MAPSNKIDLCILMVPQADPRARTKPGQRVWSGKGTTYRALSVQPLDEYLEDETLKGDGPDLVVIIMTPDLDARPSQSQ